MLAVATAAGVAKDDFSSVGFHIIMNTSDYTICNLDNQTYVTHFGGGAGHGHHHHQENGGSSVYSHGPVAAAFNGLHGDAGPPPPPPTGHYPYQPSPTLHHSTNAHSHNGVSPLPVVDISPHSQAQNNCSPLPYDGGSVISHVSQAAAGYVGGYQGQFAPYYGAHGAAAAGLMPNGCMTPDLPGSPGYPAPYPDPLGYGHGALMHPQCANPGAYLNGHGQNSQQNDSNVTTYKWMTIKRAQPKTTTPGSYDVISFAAR